MVSGIEHAWRLTPEGLQLEPITKPKSHTNVFASRALSPFQSVHPPNEKPHSAGSRPLRSRSGSPLRRKGMSESPVASKRALRSLVASASDPTHNPCSHAVVATAPEVSQAPGERTPKVIKPTIVYPISPGGTEIRPPPIAAAPRSPDVKAPVPAGSPPYPWPASNLPRRLPSLPAPPEVPSDMRGNWFKG